MINLCLGIGRRELTTLEIYLSTFKILGNWLAAVRLGQFQTLARFLSIGLSTLKLWRRQFSADGEGMDCRMCSH